MKNIFLIPIIGSILLTGCSTEQPKEEITTYNFSNVAHKIKSDIILNNEDTYLFEGYISPAGEGNGVLKHGETVYNIIISGYKLHLIADDENIIELSDINHYFADTEPNGDLTYLNSIGFSFMDSYLYSYQSPNTQISTPNSTPTIQYSTYYANHYDLIESTPITPTTSLSIHELDAFLIELTTPKEEEPPITTQYINSPNGVKLDNIIYSIGDTCEPNTYLNNLTPESISTKKKYKGDEPILLNYISYISPTGRSTVTTLNNQVVSFHSTDNFEWHGIKPNMTYQDLKLYLGLDYYNSEEPFKMPVEGLTVDYYDYSRFNLIVGDVSCTLQLYQDRVYGINISKLNEVT